MRTSDLSRLPNVGILNLGCARNTVDSQQILGRLQMNGHPIVDVNNADIAIVNTCSFIQEAKEESVDAILDLIKLKKQGKIRKIVVVGCLVQQYGVELIKELKGVDAFVGTLQIEQEKNLPKVFLTPSHYAYVKICESCYNQCSFCVIPKIKGKFSSRKIESIVDEMKELDRLGVKEVNIIGQDITAYGLDLYDKKSLTRLLKEILMATKNIQWFRLLYTFPKHVTDELLDLITSQKRVCPYIDLPIQHISDRILKQMNRGMGKKETIALIQKIRKKIPDVTLRTTLIVGFPGETDQDFQELCVFLEEMRFDRTGVFTYSKEEGTEAFDFSDQIPESIKKKRKDILMQKQMETSKQRLKRHLGEKLKVLIDERQKDSDNTYVGRTSCDAPEVDGLVYVHSLKERQPGDFVDVMITDTLEYDLVGDAT